MSKNALFLLKNRKNRRAMGAKPSDPLASGGWRLCTQTFALTSPLPWWILGDAPASSLVILWRVNCISNFIWSGWSQK